MYVRLESGEFWKLHQKKVLLFGAGSLGLRSIEECKKIDAEVIGFVDNNKARRGEMLNGYPIYAPEDINGLKDVHILITSTYADEIKEQLLGMGIKDAEVIRLGALRDVLPSEDFFRPLLPKQDGNTRIYKWLCQDAPFFIGRLGSNELECMAEYYYLLGREKKNLQKNICEPYHDNLKLVMKQGAGFFPIEDGYLDRFVQLYTDCLGDTDIIWSMWLSRFENMLYRRFAPEKEITFYEDTALPYSFKKPWTKALEGKNVLVIHPFEESIKTNYRSRKLFFGNPDVLPEFNLFTFKPVQSIADEEVQFNDWFEALSYMEEEISRIDFDIALIGAGAYGFPLGAYIKSIGKKAVHIGGMLQLLFGIKGKAWNKLGIYNEYWTSPKETERPKGYEKVEAGRYW